ncbi:hypothetical protein UlMin_028453 [Ulmus minor]
MKSSFQRLIILTQKNKIQWNSSLGLQFQSRNRHFALSLSNVQDSLFPNTQKPEKFIVDSNFYFDRIKAARFVHSVANSTEFGQDPENETAIWVQNVLKFRRDKPTEEIEQALDRCGLVLTECLVLNVLRRHRSDWKPAYVFFHWVCERGGGTGFLPGSDAYNEILDILGRMRCFEEAHQVIDKMSQRKGLINEVTYRILVCRYAAAHRVEEAIDMFYRRKEFGLELNLSAFQMLLMSLCRYKHVEDAESLFYSKQNEFPPDIKTWNIILSGWCVRGNVYEAKRFWKDIIASGCQPDLYTYGTFINSLAKKGKLGMATKLLRAMWDNGFYPDVAICNCIIDALCFKKRIPEALKVLQEMNERGCLLNVVTYNTLIKYMCKIRWMDKVYELFEEMERNGEHCFPNATTYVFLLKSLKKPEEVHSLLERMERNGCKMTNDIYNLVLKLYMDWNCQERVRHTWNEMERNGLGPDQRSYTIMIHGCYEKGQTKDALRYFQEMTSKGMQPEPRTEILVNSSKPSGQGRKGELKELGANANNDAWTSA